MTVRELVSDRDQYQDAARMSHILGGVGLRGKKRFIGKLQKRTLHSL